MSTDRIVVEVLGGHDRVRSRTLVALSAAKRSVTIGRGALADIILDDEYVAALHAEVAVSADGALTVSDLGSVNGIAVAGKRYRGAQHLALEQGELQVGRTRLRLRTTDETLPAEKPDHEAIGVGLRNRTGFATAGGCVFVCLVAYTSWLDAPRDTIGAVVIAMAIALGLASVWVAGWAFLARMLQGEWRWTAHAVIFFWVCAVFFLVDGLLDLSWFSLSLPYWKYRNTGISLVAIALALYWHLTTASGLSRRRAALVACLFPALGAGALEWVAARNHARDVNYIVAPDQIYPPALRLSSATSLTDFFNDAAQLKTGADRKRKQLKRDTESDSADEEE